MRAMKHTAVVCNIAQFHNEIRVEARRNTQWTNVKLQMGMAEFPKGHLVSLGNANNHTSYVMSVGLTNQTLAQIELS